MTTMIRRILLFLVVFCLSVPLAAQTMSVFSIDPSGFPTIQARLIVADKNEQAIRNFAPGDFTVTENGRPVSGITVTCPPLTDKGCVNVVMVIDQSLSMMELIPPANIITRLEAVKAGAATFLQTIDFKPPTVVALTSFDRYAYELHGFSGSRMPLENKVQGITPNDDIVGTNYGAGLADPFFGAIPLLQQRSKQCPRVIVFLTDGFPYNPDFYPEQADSIQKILIQEEIQLYAISIGTDHMHPLLKRIAEKSGGMAFVKDNPTVEELKGIYKRIAEQVQGAEPCSITWQSDLGCGEDSRLRKLEVVYKPLGARASEQYTAVAPSVAELRQSAYVVAFGNPAVGVPVTKQLKLTARNYAFTIDNVAFDPAGSYFQVTDWGGTVPNETLPITIAPGEERTITLTFTQAGSQQYRSAKLLLNTAPCAIEPISVWGGAPPEEGSPIRLFSPNGDRDLSICDTTTITWGGIPEYLPVRLMYSNDNGSNWNLIKDNVTGDSYVWQPGEVTDQGMIRVELLKDVIDWKWALREGDLEIDRALGLGLDGNNYSYLLGEHKGTIMVDTFELKQTRFLARYAPDGSVVWAQSVNRGSIDIATSRDGDSYVLGHTFLHRYKVDGTPSWSINYPIFPIDSLVDLAIDGSGNCWVAGITTIETGGPIDNYEIFIRKYASANGQEIFPSIARANAKLYAIAADADGNAVVAGYFQGKKGDLFGGAALEPGYFLAKFDNAGNQVWVKNTDEIQTSALACDKDGNILQTGRFTSTRKFGSIQVTSSGGEDLYIAKYQPNGTIQWVKTGGATGSTSESGVDVATDAKGNYYVTGTFEKGTAKMRIDGKEVEAKGQSEVFLVKIKPEGVVEWIQGIGGPKADSVAALCVDQAGKCYVAGSFEETAVFGVHSITSAGMKDAFVACLGVIPAGADISDSAYAVLAPQLVVKNTPLNVGDIAVGEFASATFQQVVCNTGTLPVHIVRSSIGGANSADFQLISSLDNLILQPGECRTLEIVFSPSAVGTRNASLVIEADCIPTISAPIVGVGLNPCLLSYQKVLKADDTDIGSSLATTFTNALCNTGTETIQFTVAIFGSGSGLYTLQSPATVTLGPGDCYDLIIEFTPDQPGDAPVAYVSYTSECGTLVAELSGRGVSVNPDIRSAEVYCGDILCPGGTRDTMVVIQNYGKTDLLISSVVLAKNTEGFTILSWPSKIAPQKSDTVRLNFTPATAGFKLDSLVVTSNANAKTYYIPVSGKLYDIRLDVPASLAFGTVAPRDFPVTQTLTVHNTGDATVELTAASLALPAPFVVVGGVPVILKPDSSAVITVEFGDPGRNGSFNDVMEVVCTPSCHSWSVDVSGRRSAAEAILSVPELTADPHDRNFRIPVSLVPGGDFSQAEGRKFIIEVKYNDALFFARSCSNGAIVKIDTLANEKRVVVTIEGMTPSSGTILTELIGDVLLGDTVETPVEVTVVDWEDVVGSVDQPGKLRLINTSDSGGLERLIRDRGRLLGVGRVVPNPASTEAKVYINTVEVGEHVLEVYDAGGRRIYHTSWVEVATSLEGENEITLPTEQFPVGSYNLLLRTPTRTAEGRLVVIR